MKTKKRCGHSYKHMLYSITYYNNVRLYRSYYCLVKLNKTPIFLTVQSRFHAARTLTSMRKRGACSNLV
jgi:hypothetical protein